MRTTHHSALRSGSEPRLISTRARWLRINPISTHTARTIFTIAEILHYEALGLCAVGEGGNFVASGSASLNGKTPVNVSGGLLSRGHPVAATGVAQVIELVWQLRGQTGDRQVNNAKVGLAHCMGGDKAGDTKSCTISILSV